MGFQDERKERIGRLLRWMGTKGAEAAVFLKEDTELNGYNYVYYGGNLASEEDSALIFDSSGEALAVVQEHSVERAQSSGDFRKILGTRQAVDQLVSNVKQLVGKHRPGSVLVDGSTLTWNTSQLMKKAGFVPDRSLTEFVYNQRSQKSEYEIREIEKAIKVGGEALRETADGLKAGDTVSLISLQLKKSMLDSGAASESFAAEVMIRKGVSEKEAGRLERGSLVLFDFGARLESQYLSDMGRTIPFGPDERLRDLMRNVCEIKMLGLRKIRAGLSGNEVRKGIDEVISEFGFDSVHRPGHQIGLNVHEPYRPDLAYGEENSVPLKERNIVTWEPGIGLKGLRTPIRYGLAHMEDMVLVGGQSTMLGNLPLEFD